MLSVDPLEEVEERSWLQAQNTQVMQEEPWPRRSAEGPRSEVVISSMGEAVGHHWSVVGQRRQCQGAHHRLGAVRLS